LQFRFGKSRLDLVAIAGVDVKSKNTAQF
jgi:hypothetical protein